MGRVNKSIEGVFIEITGNESADSSYNQFIKQGGNYSEELNQLTELYEKHIIEHKTTFELLSSLEEIIIQMRIREDELDIKLSQVREYIYVRVPFYRKDRKSKDIRVIVDKIDKYPHTNGDINKLLGDPEFVERSKRKLIKVMDDEIKENIRILKSIYGTI
jgi:hypothetical protein